MKAALRHAILQHEVVFRNHKNLMREMCRAAGEAVLTLVLARSQTVEVGVCDGEAMLAPARSQTVRKNWPVEVGVCDENVRKEKQREMILDFQFPADEYISGGGVPVSTGSETGIIDLNSLNGEFFSPHDAKDSVAARMAWYLSMQPLPSFLVGLGSELEKSVIFRWLLQFRGFKERLLANDLFLAKVGMDEHQPQVSGACMELWLDVATLACRWCGMNLDGIRLA